MKKRRSFIYILAKSIASFVNNCFFFLKIKGRENTDNSGKIMLVSNHLSWWDPLLMGGVFKRKVNYIAKAELFKSDFAQWFYAQLGAFPVARGQGDFGALKKSFEILKDNECLGIFPEGTRFPIDAMGEFQKGAAAIALKMKAPIIPVYFEGEFKVFKQIKMVVGKPIKLWEKFDPKDKQSVVKATEFLRNKILELKETL